MSGDTGNWPRSKRANRELSKASYTPTASTTSMAGRTRARPQNLKAKTTTQLSRQHKGKFHGPDRNFCHRRQARAGDAGVCASAGGRAERWQGRRRGRRQDGRGRQESRRRLGSGAVGHQQLPGGPPGDGHRDAGRSGGGATNRCRVGAGKEIAGHGSRPARYLDGGLSTRRECRCRPSMPIWRRRSR